VADINALENWLPEDFSFEEHYHLTKGKQNNSETKKRKIVSENENSSGKTSAEIKKTKINGVSGSNEPTTKKVSTMTPTTTSAATITSPIMSPEEKATRRERQLIAAENRKNNFQQSGIISKKRSIQRRTALGTTNRTNQLMSPSMWD